MTSPDNSASDAREAIEALIKLDAVLDFSDDDIDEVWTFEDLTAVKAAFEKAREVLSHHVKDGFTVLPSRSPAATVDVADAFSAADEADWKRLDDLLGHSAYGKFWRNVFVSVRFALTDKRPPSMQEDGK